MDISIKWNVCRVCLYEESSNSEAQDQMKDIFKDSNLSKQIFDCSGVVMRHNDNLPQKICKKCLSILKFALNFRKTCRNSDKYLQMVVQQTKSATSLFQQKKPRENSIELTDDIIDVESDDDDVDVWDNIQANNSQKQKEIHIASSSTKWMGTNKDKNLEINTNLATVGGSQGQSKHNATEVFVASTNVSRTEGTDDDIEKFIVRPREQLSELTPVGYSGEIISDAERINEDISQDKIVSTVNVKRESGTETPSEFSIEVASVDDDGGDMDLGCQNLTQKEYENDADTTAMSSVVNSLNGECSGHANEELHITVDEEPRNNEREFFYILSNAIKTENKFNYTNENDSDGGDQSQYIEVDDDLKAESVMVEETVEYLLESTDEQTQSAMDYKAHMAVNSTTGSNRPRKERSKRKLNEDFWYVCDICGNHFKSKNLLNFHMRIHRNEKNYECELCFKRFNAACNLSAHMRTHTGEKPYQCQYCERRFTDRSTHIKHERTHTNEKPYPCLTCGKAFSLSTSLKAHERIHTGEKPYKCVPCSKSFKLPHQLKAHRNTHLHKLLTIEQIN